jgi:hypothetical protein
VVTSEKCSITESNNAKGGKDDLEIKNAEGGDNPESEKTVRKLICKQLNTNVLLFYLYSVVVVLFVFNGCCFISMVVVLFVLNGCCFIYTQWLLFYLFSVVVVLSLSTNKTTTTEYK